MALTQPIRQDAHHPHHNNESFRGIITMKNHIAMSICAGVAGMSMLCTSGSAFAQQAAFTNAPADVFAGPAPDYPVVSQLPQGLQVTVYGCVAGYSWCDVAVPNLRGWIDASTLSYPYQGGYVPLETYGANIGLPIVTFSVDSYWGSYYRGQPWYHDQGRWINHPPPRPGPGPGYGHPPPSNGGHPPGPPRGNEGYAGRPPGPPPGNGHPPGPGGNREEPRPEHRGGEDEHNRPPPQ
jgi:uncharacterized protein YraI